MRVLPVNANYIYRLDHPMPDTLFRHIITSALTFSESPPWLLLSHVASTKSVCIEGY